MYSDIVLDVPHEEFEEIIEEEKLSNSLIVDTELETTNMKNLNDGIDDSNLVFLIGFPRSGTTLLDTILSLIHI